MEVNYKKISDAAALAGRLKCLENALHEITHPDNCLISVHITFDYSGEKKEITFYDMTIEEDKEQRWRAKRGESYYFVGSAFGISSYREKFDSTDNGLWNSGNYFRTADEAQKYADEFRRMLHGRTLDKEE